MKLVVAVLLALMLCFGAVAETRYVPGTYEVVTRGMDGKIYFEIEFSEDAIVDIRVTKLALRLRPTQSKRLWKRPSPWRPLRRMKKPMRNLRKSRQYPLRNMCPECMRS